MSYQEKQLTDSPRITDSPTFILALSFMPLLIASGAGAASRIAVGLAVVGGMIAATIFSLLFVPSFFVVFQTLGEWGGGQPDPSDKDADE